jgi:uridine kinase
VAAEGVVVVEGVYVARPALRGYLDLIVAVEAPRELCLERQRARGENDPAEIERWRAAEDWYLEHQNPGRVADVVVDGA